MGFTLIEAMVTVTIIGVLAFLAAPAYTRMVERNRVKAVAEGLYNDLQLARSEAIKRNRTVELRFNAAGPTTNWCYGLRLADGTACDCTETDAGMADACQIDGVPKVTRSTDFARVSLQNTFLGNVARFNPRSGRATVSGSAYLILGASELRVVLSPLGRVKICTTTGIPGYASCS